MDDLPSPAITPPASTQLLKQQLLSRHLKLTPQLANTVKLLVSHIEKTGHHVIDGFPRTLEDLELFWRTVRANQAQHDFAIWLDGNYSCFVLLTYHLSDLAMRRADFCFSLVNSHVRVHSASSCAERASFSKRSVTRQKVF